MLYPKVLVTEVYTLRGSLKNMAQANAKFKSQIYFDMKECKDVVMGYITAEALDREIGADPDEPGPVLKGGMVRIDPTIYNVLT